MNVIQPSSRRSVKAAGSTEKTATKINLYQEIPDIEVSLDDFEEYALDRLKVLKKIEILKMDKLNHTEKSKWKGKLDPLLLKLKDSQKDWISHFVLRLAYCRSEDLRRWFLTQEVALLRCRLDMSTGSATKALASVLPEAKLLRKEQLDEVLPSIMQVTPKLAYETKFYQVPFVHALDLVQSRQVFLHRGMAYIPESKLINLVTARFRTSLSRQLVMLAAVPITPGLERTQGFLKNVSTVHQTKDFESQQGVTDLNANNVPAHLKHMPLCMAQLQRGLKRDKHLKHWGRLQYGLFLKGAGLSLEDALMYFERMFVGKGFGREYAYNWRHMYGKEGKRVNYPPYSCSKIINSNAPNANDHHGCPFKHGTVQEVTNLLGAMGVGPSQQKAILAQQKSHNYQLACVEHFKAVHTKSASSGQARVDDLGNHPNAWFHASVAYHKAHVKPNETPSGAVTTQPSPQPDSQPSSVSVSP